jgi:hypothetical protein
VPTTWPRRYLIVEFFFVSVLDVLGPMTIPLFFFVNTGLNLVGVVTAVMVKNL